MKAIKFILSKSEKFGFILVVAIAATSCLGWQQTIKADKNVAKLALSEVESAIVEGNNKFAIDLYDKLKTREGNLFFSPYSISTALAMTYAGAQGQTESQMTKVLHFPTQTSPVPPQDASRQSEVEGETTTSTSVKSPRGSGEKTQFHSAFGTIVKDLNARGRKGGYELTAANALWGQKSYGFLKEFLELIKTNYDGQLNEVNFIEATETAGKTINAWVEKKTNNKIKELIKPGVLDAMTRLVLTNAIYFKGNWAAQFKKDQTRNAPFTLLNRDKVEVLMMNQTEQFPYMETEDFQALELPYVDNELSMIIFLPKETDGLKEFEQNFTLENVSRWLSKLGKRKVIVSIPKFKMTSQFSLASVLKSMGMTDAFDSKAADFSGMTGRKDLCISAVIHKAYVDVNEEGTEAAAATGVTMRLTSVGPDQTPVFRADHPFIFLIRDNHSESILFIGRVMNPNI